MTTTSFPTDGPGAAAYYIAKGFMPVPVTGRTKTITRTGWDKERVKPGDSLTKFAGVNTGLLLGALGETPGGHVDVDLDCREAVVAAAHLLPKTGLVSGRVSNPCSHHWYFCPASPMATERFTDAAGDVLVELRATGMTLVPPSINPGDGDNGHTPEPVVWEELGEPATVHHADLRRAVSEVAAAALLARRWPKTGRHFAALHLSGALLRAPGWDVDRVKRLLRAVCAAAEDDEPDNRLKCVDDTHANLADPKYKVTGWPKLIEVFGQAVADKLKEWLDPPPTLGGRKGTPEPAAWVPPTPFGRDAAPPEFPLDVLPPWLGGYVRALARFTQTPPAAGGLLALAAVAGGLSAAVRYQVRDKFTKNANLYVCVTMLSAERKSAVFKAIFAPVFATEKAAVEAATPAIAERTAEKGVLEARLKKKQTAASAADEPDQRRVLTDEAKALAAELAAFDVPVPPVYLVDDETMESLGKTLIEQGGRLLQAAPEGTAFEIAGGRHADSENFDVYLKAHDGDPLRYGRVGRGRSGCDDPRLTCGLAVQPDVLRGLGRSAKAKGRGFLARWLYAVPAQMAGQRLIRQPPVPADVQARYDRALAALWSLTPPADGTAVVPFTRAADDALAAFEARVEPQLADGGQLAGLASWGGKVCGEAARLAGTLHLAAAADRPGGIGAAGPVPAGAVAAAVRLADEFLIPHARLAFAAMHLDPVEVLARRVLGWLARNPEIARFYRRDVYQDLKGGGSDLKSDDLIPAFDRLAEHNYLRPDSPPGGPGRPPEVWAVNPLWVRDAHTPRPNPPKPDVAEPDARVSGDSGEGSADVRPQERHPDEDGGAGESNPNADVPPPNPPKPDGTGDPLSPDADPDGPPGAADDFDFGANVRPDPAPDTPTVGGVGSVPADYTLVIDVTGGMLAAAAVRAAEAVGLDLETTGLDPRTDRVRLLALHTPAGTFLVDCFALDPAPLFDALAGVEVVGHNLQFDLGFLHRLGFAPGRAFDTLLASQVLDAGDRTVRHAL